MEGFFKAKEHPLSSQLAVGNPPIIHKRRSGRSVVISPKRTWRVILSLQLLVLRSGFFQDGMSGSAPFQSERKSV